MAFILKKEFNNIKGMDLRVSDLLREPGAATEVNNVMYRQTGALSKRKGFQHKTSLGAGGGGLFRFNNIDVNTGVITEELLCCDNNLHIYTSNTFSVTYSGSDSAYYDMYYDADNSAFYFDIYDNNTRVLNQSLGSGLGGSDTTVTQLVAAINAVTDFSASVSGSPSTPAAFIDVARVSAISTSGTDINFYTWEQIVTPNNYSNPFSAHYSAINDVDFEVASTVTVDDVLYISNGYSDLHKYDGNRVYKTGLAKGTTPSAADTSGSTFAGSEEFQYKYIYTYIDAKENTVVSNATDTYSHTTSGSTDINVTIYNLQDSSGYNTDQGVVNGGQSGVTTITVDSGHTLQVGDYVYIDDGVTSTVVSRKITATTATSITISGDAVNVSDNDIISCIKITLLRTKDTGTLFYEHTDLVNDSSNTTQVVLDQKLDAALLVEFIEPIRARDNAPKGRYIDVWRGQIVITGNRENVNTVYYSDIDSPEYFPATSNNFRLASKIGGGNTGIKVFDNTLFIFKPESIITVTGDLASDNNNFRVDVMSDEGIGCIAHATIKEVDRRVWFLGNKGVYSLNASEIRSESEPIDPRFDGSYSSRRSIAFHWIDRDMYVLLLPTLATDSSSNEYYSSSSKILIFDKYRRAWLQWSNWNCLGNMAEYNDEIYFQGIDLNPTNATATSYTNKVMEQGTLDDYLDHVDAISFTYKSHWESLQEPSVFKKFNRIKILSLDGSINDFETDNFSLNVNTEHDFTASAVSSLTLNFGGGLVGWGASAWGNFPWGESRLLSEQSKLASKKAKSLRTVFSNNQKQQNVLISGWEYEIAAPFDPAIKE